jgi:hypothetical protein
MEMEMWATEPQMMVSGIYVSYVEAWSPQHERLLHRIPVYFHPLDFYLPKSSDEVIERLQKLMQAGQDKVIASYMATTRGLTA